MVDCEAIKLKLEKVYRKKISVRIGESSDIEYNLGEKYSLDLDIAVYISKKYEKVAIWNLKRRRDFDAAIKSPSLKFKWMDIDLAEDQIKSIYKQMRRKKDASYEKVLVLSIDTLNDIYEYLYDYLEFDYYDDEYPEDKKNTFDTISRKRRSTSSWERDRKFREKVLESYDNKCAICRCDERKILQAAHINAVSKGGNDESENGICLCANHHLMFDKDLIKIDIPNNKLTFVSGSVKKMSWYKSFIEEYSGELLPRIK